MEQMINQMVDILKSGVIMGGAYSVEDRDAAVLYYYEDGQFYVGNAENGGPGVLDEPITEEELRRRLEAHANSLSTEELEEDKKEVADMHARILEERAIEAAEEEPGIEVSFNQAYSLLRLVDELAISLWVKNNELEYKEAIDAVRSMYCQLPLDKQKDIQELNIFTILG